MIFVLFFGSHFVEENDRESSNGKLFGGQEREKPGVGSAGKPAHQPRSRAQMRAKPNSHVAAIDDFLAITATARVFEPVHNRPSVFVIRAVGYTV